MLKLLASYVIPLDPRTKKNSMTIAGKGPRCPACKRALRQYIRQGRANSEYTAAASRYMVPKPEHPLEGPLHIIYKLYMKTHRVVDDLNLYASLDDILVKEKIIKDDSIRYIKCRDGSSVDYDKEHPRAEIYIYQCEEVGTDGERNEDVHH